MTEKEKFDYLIEKGYYATEDGKVISFTGKILKPYKNNSGYQQIKVRFNEEKHLSFLSHRFIYFVFTKKLPKQIDHINRIKDDNRLINLRESNNSENGFNKISKGYDFHKSTKKWRARIHINKKAIHLGLFDNEDEARQAYLDAKKIYHVIQ